MFPLFEHLHVGETDCSMSISLTEGVCSVPAASSSVTISPTSESSAIQIIEATLNNSSSASAESRSGSTAVTQQMTEMSISCEDEVVSPKVELPEPGWYFCFRLE